MTVLSHHVQSTELSLESTAVITAAVFNIYMYLTRIYGNLKQIQPDLECSYFVFVFFRMPNLIQPATRAAVGRSARREARSV